MKVKHPAEGDISQNAALLCMLLIMFLSYAMMMTLMNLQISHDELSSLTTIGFFEKASGPFEITALVRKHTPDHVPLFSIITSYWADIVGFAAFPLRLPSLLMGLALLALVYRLAADTFDRRVAVLAALLFSFSSLAATRFHIIRVFPMVMLLAYTHTWLYWRLAHGKGGRGRDWLAFVLSASALFYTHYFAPLILAGLGLYHIFVAERTRRWRRALLGWALAFAMASPTLPLMASGIIWQTAKIEDSPGLTTTQLLGGLGIELVNHAAVLWLPLALGIGLALWRGGKSGVFARLGFVVLAGILVMVVFDSVARYVGLHSLRYFLPLWHIVIILVAAALFQLPWRRLTVTAFVVIWLAAGHNLLFGPREAQPVRWTYRFWAYHVDRYPPLQQWAYALRGKTHDRDFMLGFEVGGYVNYLHPITGGAFADYYLAQELEMDGVFLPASDKKYRLKRDVEAVMRARPYVLVGRDPRVDMPNYKLALHHMEKVFAACPPLVDEPDTHIQRFAHEVVGCDHAPAAAVDYDNGFRLLDRAVRHDGESNAIQALLWWEIPDESMLDDFNISLQLFDANGDKAAQNDYHLNANLTPWGVAELPLGDLSEGDYQLKLILYDRHDGGKVSGVDETMGESAALLPLFDFEAGS